MDAVEDLTTRIGATIRMDDEAKKKAREELAAGPIPRFLQQLEARLKAGGGEWFVENRLTVADLKCYILVRWLKSGVIDHVPSDIVDRNAPLLAKHLERVANHPKIAAYYAARKK
jgi:glutathione S-transferase